MMQATTEVMDENKTNQTTKNDDTIVYGPGKATSPGGVWYKIDQRAVSNDAGSLCAAILFCDFSICCAMWCPLKTQYIYRDPKTLKLHGEDGSVLPVSYYTSKKMVPVSTKQLKLLQKKYRPIDTIPTATRVVIDSEINPQSDETTVDGSVLMERS